MIFTQFLKSSFTSIPFTLLMTLQITACNIAAPSATTDAVRISGIDTGSVTENIDPDGDNLLEASGKLNITDRDGTGAAFIAETITSDIGSLTIDAAGNWRYTADNRQSVIQSLAYGATLTDSMIVSSVDGTSHTVVITIFGADGKDTFGDISLSWVAPVEREDKTSLSLSQIAGYKIYFGTTSGQYTDSVVINDGSAEGYTFEGLTTGTYYLAITTLDTGGRESQKSFEITAAI